MFSIANGDILFSGCGFFITFLSFLVDSLTSQNLLGIYERFSANFLSCGCFKILISFHCSLTFFYSASLSCSVTILDILI